LWQRVEVARSKDVARQMPQRCQRKCRCHRQGLTDRSALMSEW
jgi:hypothetical protein